MKRSKLLIEPVFQYRVIRWMMAISIAPVCVFFSAHYYYFWKLKRLGENLGLPEDHVYFRFIETQGQELLVIFILCALITGLIVAGFGLFFSHKVAGPIYRLRTYFREMPDSKLSFREGDFFNDLPPVINESLEKVKNGKRG
jgi:hypothetical protein